MKILVTTGLEETYGSNEEILFAGDWIKSDLNIEENLKKRKYNFFDSVWKDTEDIKVFLPYITELRNKILNKLSSNLNEIHKTEYPLRFWQIIINPWLHYYLETTYSSFKTIKKILDKKENLNFVYLSNLENFEAPFDVRDYMEYISRSDVYNQFIFQEIIKYFVDIKKNKYLNLIYSKNKIEEKLNLDFLKISKEKNILRKFSNLLFQRLSNKNKFFLDLNINKIHLVLLNLKLKQIPFKDFEFFTLQSYRKLFEKKSPTNREFRKKIFFNFNKQDDYENFLSKDFARNIPKFLIEDFITVKNFVEKIPYKPKIIVSDVKHENDTLFKFWVANSVKNGAKLITSDHGGTYTGLFYNSMMVEDISDVAIRWFKPIKDNNVQLPVLHLLNKKRNKNKNKRKYLLVLGFDGTKYPRHLFLGPIAGQILYQVECLSSFYKNLDLKLKDNFLFKPHPMEIGDWNFEKRFEHIFQKKIIFTANKYWHYVKKSKIIVCTYPKTTFCEAMISGPTILLFKENYFKNREEFKSLHENLRKVKILFDDPILASKHLNEIWNNVDDWWESEDVKMARKRFIKEAVLLEPNALEKWKNFLNNF